MAYATIEFENPDTGLVKEAPVGFSWTVLLFCFFPPIFRGDWKWATLMFLLAMLSWGLSALVFMFIYNKLYIDGLISAGYRAKSIDKGAIDDVSQSLGINIPLL